MFTSQVIFFCVVLGFMLILSLYSQLRYKRVRNWTDWASLILSLLLLSTLLTALSTTIKAEELKTFQYTDLFVGIEYPLELTGSGLHPACQRNDDQMVINAGADQNIITWHQINVDLTLRHNSCIVGGDREVTDTIGINLIHRFTY